MRSSRDKSAFRLSDDGGTTEPPFDESLLAKVRAVPGVAAAEPSVDGEAQLIGDDGKAIVYGGAPNLGFSIANGDSRFNPLTLVDGAWPGPGEVVIDRSTVDKEGLEIGQTIGVQAEGPVERLRISGVVKFGSVATIGGATLAGFALPTAQHLFERPGKLDEIAVAAEPSVSDAELIRRIRSILPAGDPGAIERGTGRTRTRGAQTSSSASSRTSCSCSRASPSSSAAS